MEYSKPPLKRLYHLVREERSEISIIYFYAILGGLIQLSLPLGIQSIIGFVIGGTMSTSLVILISLMVVAVLFNGLLQMNQMKLIERIQQKIFVRFSFAFARHIPKLDLQKIDAYYLPELVNRFFDIPVLQKSMSKILLEFPLAIFQILLGLILLSFYHQAFLVFGFLLIMILFGVFYLTGNKGFRTSLEKSHYKYQVAGWIEEMARVIRSFKFTGTGNLHMQKADENVLNYVRARKRHFSILLLQYRVLIALKVVVTAAMLIVGSILLLDQQINIGQFVAAEIVVIIVINSVEKLIINLDSVYSVMTSIEKINKLLDKPAETQGALLLEYEQGIKIEFRNVSYSYPDKDPVIRDLSAKIAAGEKVGIRGRVGSGKSTLLRLLSGAYNSFTGGILINDVPIGNYDLTSLRRRTGIVLNEQDVFLGTLWENLTMNSENVDRNHIMELCAAFGLQDFIAGSKNGFDTLIDPMGHRLAKNTVQKILMVRALALKPQLLLLEEPWLGMPVKYKEKIQDYLFNLENTTVLVITDDQRYIDRCQSTIDLSPLNEEL
jgi:ATP-binding cassette, subfamily B, bacterial